MEMDTTEQCDPKASMVKLDMTEFGLLFIGEGANEIHHRIIADQWVDCNPHPG